MTGTGTERSTDSGPAPRTHFEALMSYYDAELRYVAAGGAPAGVDFSEVGAHFHPDVVTRQGPTVPYAGDWHGITGLEVCFAEFTATWSALDLTQTRYFEGESGVAVTMRMQATARSTGKRLDTQVGHFFIFDGGLIREFTVFYLDPVQVRDVTIP